MIQKRHKVRPLVGRAVGVQSHTHQRIVLLSRRTHPCESDRIDSMDRYRTRSTGTSGSSSNGNSKSGQRDISIDIEEPRITNALSQPSVSMNVCICLSLSFSLTSVTFHGCPSFTKFLATACRVRASLRWRCGRLCAIAAHQKKKKTNECGDR